MRHINGDSHIFAAVHGLDDFNTVFFGKQKAGHARSGFIMNMKEVKSFSEILVFLLYKTRYVFSPFGKRCAVD